MDELVPLRVWVEEVEHHLEAPLGANLRRFLIAQNLSPYARLTQRLNCGGRGLCATCGVWIQENEPEPTHWHDRIARRYGYSRLSCQVTISEPMVIRLDTEKKIWGKPKR
ncbi:MAG: (2Fe-2S)-binding protein [Bacteroidota bacterium]